MRRSGPIRLDASSTSEKKYSNIKPKEFKELLFDFTDYSESQNLNQLKFEEARSNNALIYAILMIFILGFMGICINMFCVETPEQRRAR